MQKKQQIESQPLNQNEQQLTNTQNQHTFKTNVTFPPINLELSMKVFKALAVVISSLTFLFILSFIFQIFHNFTLQVTRSNKLLTHRQALPKIVWLYTDNEVEAEQVMQQVFIYYYNSTVPKYGYEIRLINSWNAYDWLTEITTQRITKAMQNTRLDASVSSFLKLGILLENGGILISAHDFLIISQNLNWIEDLFVASEDNLSENYLCDPKQATVFMQRAKEVQTQVFHPTYSQGLMAALPHSPIIRQAFDICEDMFLFGTVPEDKELKLIDLKWQNNALGLYNPLETAINLALYRLRVKDKENKTCFGMQQIKTKYIYRMEQNYLRPMNVLLQENQKEELVQKGIKVISAKILWRNVISYLYDCLMGKQNAASLSSKSLMYELINVPNNKQVFIDVLPERQVELCLIIMEELSAAEITTASNAYINQTFNKWRLVLPTTNPETITGIKDPRIHIMKSKSTEVHNIQHAAIKQCDTKGYAILLHYGQNFNDTSALEQIAAAVKPRNVVGGIIGLLKEDEYLPYDQMVFNFNRVRDGIVNPKIEMMQSLLNHMRIISIESFRYMPQFDLRDIYGNYFKDRIIILMTLVELAKSKVTDYNMLYLIRKYANVWNVPEVKVQINSSIAITIKNVDKIDQEQLRKTRTRIDCQSIEQTMRNLLQYRIPFSKILVFNPGEEYISVKDKKGQDIIPKIIHQAWMGTNNLPPAKQYTYEKTKIMYPTYEVKLWRESNLTRENFPMTYDLLHNLIDFNRNSPYNKLATVTDILRHEILYREGGFWKDAGMNLLRPVFDDFRKYKIVLPVDRTFRFRWLQGMCFFANAPKLPNMWRITNYRNLNRMKIYDNDAMKIAGPVDFRQFVNGYEEYDPEYLLMPYETFYPGQITQHPENDRCTKRYQELLPDEKYILVQNGWYLLSNCKQLYPFAFGIEHNRFGNTWQKRKPGFEPK